MNNNIKNFNIFANENNVHKDIDPYGEENWNEKDRFNLNDFNPHTLSVETVFHVAVEFGGETLEYQITHNEDFGWDIELKYELDVNEETMNFIEEHYEEINQKLIDVCR